MSIRDYERSKGKDVEPISFWHADVHVEAEKKLVTRLLFPSRYMMMSWMQLFTFTTGDKDNGDGLVSRVFCSCKSSNTNFGLLLSIGVPLPISRANDLSS